MNTSEAQQVLEAARATLNAAKYCFLITHSMQGEMHARLMQPFGPDEDLTIWFGVSPTSRKVDEIQAHGTVLLAYSLPEENAYVSLHARATIVEDAGLRGRYWREGWKVFWPEGPDGDNYTLIRCAPYKVEVMNFKRDIAPEPYGLRPAVLTKETGDWTLVEEAVD